MLDLTTTLDPRFNIAYRFGAIFLAERYPAGDAIACARAVARLLARAEQDRETMQRSAVRAAERIPTVREQFEQTYTAYATLLARRAREA